jgi:hypothetical protein
MDPNELTPQSAPRDVTALAACTPYQLRRLAETHLAGLRNEQEKMAWFGLKTPESKAVYILELLKRWDTQNPGAAAPHTNGVAAPAAPAAPEIQRTPVSTQPSTSNGVPVQQMQPVQPTVTTAPPIATPAAAGAGMPGFIPVVAPSAVAAATAAAGAASDKPKTTRAPKTAGAAPGDLGADVVNLLTRILEGQDKDRERYDAMQKSVANTLEEAASVKSGRLEQVESNLSVLQKQVEGLITLQQSTSQVLVWTLMAVATSNPSASPLDVLRSAINDSDSFPALVQQARGK